MWTAKVPILLLLIRVFGQLNRWLRITATLTIIFTGLAILAGDAYNAHICMPPKDDAGFTVKYLLGCVNVTLYTGVAVGSIGILADVIIFILPLPVIAKLQLATEKKIGLVLVFLAGMGSVVSIAIPTRDTANKLKYHIL